MKKKSLEELIRGPEPEAVIYKRIDGKELKLYLCRPETGAAVSPAVLCIHGGGWHSETPARMFPISDILPLWAMSP